MISYNLFIYIITPIALSCILHMYIVKNGILPNLVKPISKRLFGTNKTIRAFVVLPLLLLSIFYNPIEQIQPIQLGFYIGLIYLLAELPNSFIKRRLAISPGESPSILTLFFDKADSPFAICLFLYLINIFPAQLAFISFLASLVINLLISSLLVTFKIKKAL